MPCILCPCFLSSEKSMSCLGYKKTTTKKNMANECMTWPEIRNTQETWRTAKNFIHCPWLLFFGMLAWKMFTKIASTGRTVLFLLNSADDLDHWQHTDRWQIGGSVLLVQLSSQRRVTAKSIQSYSDGSYPKMKHFYSEGSGLLQDDPACHPLSVNGLMNMKTK